MQLAIIKDRGESMRLLREMETIQIDITNACVHECSNCSRMCGNHKKPFMMDFDTFKAAIDSLEDFEGMVGIIGGELTLHPEFEKFIQYAGTKIKERTLHDQYFFAPKKDYMQSVWSYSSVMKQLAKARGLVISSTIPKQYYKHYELITDYFTCFRVNDHSSPSYHQPSMIAYRDLGISDEEFLILRDNCWLHGKWSATINPKGAFFCEMAGALDVLFNGPGGWKIEQGWWKREIEDYKDQWHWCELCGMCLTTCTRDANEEVDDVTETLYKMLEEIESPRLKKDKLHVYSNKEQDERSKKTIGGNYILDYRERLGSAKENLKPIKIDIMTNIELSEARKQADFQNRDWILVSDDYDQEKMSKLTNTISEMFVNLGVLYHVRLTGLKGILFNVNAFSLRGIDVETDIASIWDKEKQYTLEDGFERDPDMDLVFFEEEILKMYKNDAKFMTELEERLLQIDKNKPVLVFMTSQVYNIRAITRLLLEMQYKVHILASSDHKCNLTGLLPETSLHFFENDKFDLEKLEKYTDKLKDRAEFAGALIPTSATADHLIYHDGYNEAIKVARHMKLEIIGIINAKRRFCSIDQLDIGRDTL